MAYFSKGNSTSFIFEKTDAVKLLKLIFENDLILYKHTVDEVSQQTINRIDTGRIAITTEWEEDEGIIRQANYEKDVYKMLQGFIRKLSAGKISGLFIGEQAYSLWENNQVELCQMLQGRFTYQIDDFKKKR